MNSYLQKKWFLDVSFIAMAVLVMCGCSGSDVQKGEACLKIGDFSNAIFFFDKAVRVKPSSESARYGLARAWYQKCQYLEMEGLENEEDLRGAIRHLEYSSNLGFKDSLSTHLAYTLFRLSKYFISKNDSAKALQLAERAVRIDHKSSELLNYAGILNYHSGEQKVAEDYFIIASENDTTDITGLFNLGMMAWYKQDYRFAHKVWFKALKRAPDNETIINWFAEAEVKLLEER